MEGLIYYNIGLKCLVRLCVSISTLVRYFYRPVFILSDPGCYEECAEIADHFGVGIIKSKFETSEGKNLPFLNKCRINNQVELDKTLFLDSDTIVLQDFSECFNLLDEYEFITSQFANWKSSDRHYSRRIENWRTKIDDSYIDHAYDEEKAVNIGFYGWTNKAEIFDKWFALALCNRDSFIPDEIACQILLPWVSHLVIDSMYNTSCKHELLTDKSKVLHFHGRKHCRIENDKYLYHSDMWYKEFDKIRDLSFVKKHIKNDRQLVKNLPLHDKIKNEQ